MRAVPASPVARSECRFQQKPLLVSGDAKGEGVGRRSRATAQSAAATAPTGCGCRLVAQRTSSAAGTVTSGTSAPSAG